LTALLKTYYCTGGMPEAVATYLDTRSLPAVRSVQRDILELFRLDFSKHIPPNQLARVWQIWDYIPQHLSRENKRLIWGAVREGARAKDFEVALQWLVDIGLVYQVPNITKPAQLLQSYSKPGIFKLYMLDIGLLGAMVGLSAQVVLEGDAVFSEFKGALTEQFVCQELIAQFGGGHYGMHPYYWTGKQAAVDFVVSFDNEIVPIEVKAAENLKSQSLKSYIQKFAPKHAIRTSFSPYRLQDTMTNVPLYAISELGSVVHT